MVKVSICIPTYNNAGEVSHLLDSIFAQDYRSLEVNISDDSTNTEIEEVVKHNAERFEREQISLHYIHNDKPLGHIFNWNAAIGMATGEYIKIMFSDDWFTRSDSLSLFVKMLDEHSEADIAFCGSRQVMLPDSNQESIKHVTEFSKQQSYDRCASAEFIECLKSDYRNLFLGNQIGAPSAVIYRRNEQAALFDEKSNWASDMFLYFDILQKNPKFVYTNEPLISIGVHEHQYTESFAERDMRIYNDYKYLYTKYLLADSKACRDYFLKSYIVKYRRGIREAIDLQISGWTYVKVQICEFMESVRCFVRHRFLNK
ncbi:MAG: glycosyltransferase family 2 protein [Lachnospiraceae bacterium]|nr:glycosyltransferase family 2 protein [Lachnospiraceae bacterium]